MAWLIGVDEAGYGPNLGPLTIAATAWRVDSNRIEPSGEPGRPRPRYFAAKRSLPENDLSRAPGSGTTRLAGLASLAEFDLYEQLAKAVSREVDGERIAIADSKRLYKPGGGLRLLERGVFAALMCRAAAPERVTKVTRAGLAENDDAHKERAARGAETAPANVALSWNSLLETLAADPADRRCELPWCDRFDLPLPVDASGDELAEVAQLLGNACGQAGVAPPKVRARMVFPAEFNDLVDKYDTKGAALSHVTIGLLRELIDQTDGEPVWCVLDKHGGRNRYGALLQHHFPEAWIETHDESRAASRYAWRLRETPITATFQTGGEAFLPAALASMNAKYLRELAMRALNQFWARQIPGLKPTAGYPVDAKRFRAQIAEKQSELGIDDRILWRNR